MPGSHFSSKRLRKALQTKSDPRMAGTVPRVGTPLATMRLLPRVEKHCGCDVREPKPPAFIVKAGRLQNNNQIVDPLDSFGNNSTSWIESSGIKVGDTVSYTVGGTELTTTVAQFVTQGATNTKYLILVTDPHNQGMVNANVKLYI